MMIGQNTRIGTVQNVIGCKISVLLTDENFLSSMPVIDGKVYRIGQIGSFLRIPMGYINLYGVVTQAGVDSVPESLKENYPLGKRWITMVLVGERIGERFERGVGRFPTVDDQVHLVTTDDLKVIYRGLDDTSSISVGQISASESLHACLDVDKLVVRHGALLGSTGSGKSNAVTVMLSEISKDKFPSARVLLIDPHGEYSSALGQKAKVFKIHPNSENNEFPLYVPYWALPFGELLKTFVGSLNDTQEEYIREKVFEKRHAGSKQLSSPPDEALLSADSPIPFSLKQLWYELDRFERMTINKTGAGANIQIEEALIEEGDLENLKSAQFSPHAPGGGNPSLNNQAKGILRYLNTMRNRLSDQRFNFLFHPGDWEPNLENSVSKDLDGLLVDWLGHDYPITILDLSGVPSEIMSLVSGAVIRIVYDALFWGQKLPIGGKQQPLYLVLEEAHTYLQAGEDSVASRIVKTIAKEGRKYGVGLLLVTQRPSELDITVLSQCGTVIALRMTNSNDRGHISSAIHDDFSDMISLLPSLRNGEALIIGEAVRIPSRVQFDLATKMPESGDPLVSKSWMNKRPDSQFYAEAIKSWRNGRFELTSRTTQTK